MESLNYSHIVNRYKIKLDKIYAEKALANALEMSNEELDNLTKKEINRMDLESCIRLFEMYEKVRKFDMISTERITLYLLAKLPTKLEHVMSNEKVKNLSEYRGEQVDVLQRVIEDMINYKKDISKQLTKESISTENELNIKGKQYMNLLC